jgi:hypothetical protein
MNDDFAIVTTLVEVNTSPMQKQLKNSAQSILRFLTEGIDLHRLIYSCAQDKIKFLRRNM